MKIQTTTLLLILFTFSQTYCQTDTIQPAPASNLRDTAHYCTIYVYRQRNMVGSLAGYNLHLNDSVICRVKNNSKYAVRIYHEGIAKIWAKTEKKADVTIKLEFGKSYYLRCGLTMGLIAARPLVELVIPEQGKLDYDAVEGRKNDKTESDN